jgi:hypothetical protein
VIWAYLGPARASAGAAAASRGRRCRTHRSGVQGDPGEQLAAGARRRIDTSHAPILHRLLTNDSKRPGFKPDNPFVRGKAPRLELDVTDYGYRYAGVRPLDEASIHVRTYHFILPFHQIRPSRSEGGVPLVAGHIWVPIDDENTMVYNWDTA